MYDNYKTGDGKFVQKTLYTRIIVLQNNFHVMFSK